MLFAYTDPSDHSSLQPDLRYFWGWFEKPSLSQPTTGWGQPYSHYKFCPAQYIMGGWQSTWTAISSGISGAPGTLLLKLGIPKYIDLHACRARNLSRITTWLTYVVLLGEPTQCWQHSMFGKVTSNHTLSILEPTLRSGWWHVWLASPLCRTNPAFAKVCACKRDSNSVEPAATSCCEHVSRRQRVVLFERWKAVCNIPTKVKRRTGPNIPVILQWFLMPTKIKYVHLRTKNNLHLQVGKQNNTLMTKPLQNHNHNHCLYGKILQQERITLNHNQPSWNKLIRCCCMSPLGARGVEVVCVFHSFKYNSNFQLYFFGWSGSTWKSLN